METKISSRRLRKILDEDWKEISGSEGKYFISNYGRIKSYIYDKNKGYILHPHILRGYFAVSLKQIQCSKYVHKLVAENWLTKPSTKHNFVIHLDGNKRNNYYKNLAWATSEEVRQRSSNFMKDRNKKLSKEKLITYSKLKEDDVRVIKSMLAKGITQNVIAKLFKISEMQVTRIKRGENWGHVTINKNENTIKIKNSKIELN